MTATRKSIRKIDAVIDAVIDASYKNKDARRKNAPGTYLFRYDVMGSPFDIEPVRIRIKVKHEPARSKLIL